MKTLAKILSAAALGSAAVSYAGPGPQFWNRPAPKPAPLKSQTTEMSAPATPSGLMCDRMWVASNNPKQGPYHVVKCTPETMRNSVACQQACAQAMKKG